MRPVTYLPTLTKSNAISQIVLSIVQRLIVLGLALLKSTTKQNLTFSNPLYLCKGFILFYYKFFVYFMVKLF